VFIDAATRKVLEMV